jgi:hypothetical protein
MLQDEFPDDFETLQEMDMLDELDYATPHGWVTSVNGVVGVSTSAKARLKQSLPD